LVSGDERAYGFVNGPLGPLKLILLPMFFTLSGFLVARSMERSATIEGFLTLKILGIVPALAVEVLLSAMLLGPIFTSLSLGEYLSSHLTYVYFLNVVGEVQFHLPGVFVGNPGTDLVNSSLWTIPFELESYVAIVVVTVIGLFRRPRLMAFVVVTLWLGMWSGNLFLTRGAGFTRMVVPGHLLVVCFLAGVTIHLNREIIPRSGLLAVASAILSLIALRYDQTKVLCVFPAAYLTVWLGLLNPPKIPVLMDGDYSYGVYLFAFPIQQALAAAPATAVWYVNLILATAVSLLYAAFSWSMIEKPILSKKGIGVMYVERVFAPIRRAFRQIPVRTLLEKEANS
jgi:peptidoglycan/LPS O-acetylase OafA/YrhL